MGSARSPERRGPGIAWERAWRAPGEPDPEKLSFGLVASPGISFAPPGIAGDAGRLAGSEQRADPSAFRLSCKLLLAPALRQIPPPRQGLSGLPASPGTHSA